MKTITLSVAFQRSTRHLWSCRRCGAAVVDIEQHASWHATTEAGAASWPPDPGRHERTQEITVHIDDDGRPIR